MIHSVRCMARLITLSRLIDHLLDARPFCIRVPSVQLDINDLTSGHMLGFSEEVQAGEISIYDG